MIHTSPCNGGSKVKFERIPLPNPAQACGGYSDPMFDNSEPSLSCGSIGWVDSVHRGPKAKLKRDRKELSLLG